MILPSGSRLERMVISLVGGSSSDVDWFFRQGSARVTISSRVVAQAAVSRLAGIDGDPLGVGLSPHRDPLPKGNDVLGFLVSVVLPIHNYRLSREGEVSSFLDGLNEYVAEQELSIYLGLYYRRPTEPCAVWLTRRDLT